MSSSDGFCSTLTFAPLELGQHYVPPVPIALHHERSASSSNSTPIPTPTQAASPSLVKASPVPPPIKVSHSPTGAAARPSPTRSSSASSINTTSLQQSANTVVNNPTPTFGTIPLVTATNSGPPLPFTTPPQTPISGVSHSAHSSVSGSVLGKRDIGTASESERDESKEPSQKKSEQPPKKRRIAPTLVSTGSDEPVKRSENVSK
jgi:chromatin assembly factor 1 subunit B